MQPQLPIRAPAVASVATTNIAAGAYLTAGSQLAIAYHPTDV